MALVRPSGGGGCPGGARQSGPDDLAGLYPTLWEYIASVRWEDGTARQPSSLLLFIEDGYAKLCLNDRELQRTGWATGASVAEAAEALEAALATGRIEWRKARPQGGKPRR